VQGHPGRIKLKNRLPRSFPFRSSPGGSGGSIITQHKRGVPGTFQPSARLRPAHPRGVAANCTTNRCRRGTRNHSFIFVRFPFHLSVGFARSKLGKPDSRTEQSSQADRVQPLNSKRDRNKQAEFCQVNGSIDPRLDKPLRQEAGLSKCSRRTAVRLVRRRGSCAWCGSS
jgi:hypothetical protein